MYRLDTGQARTDIYDGQPLDLSMAANLMMQTRKEKDAKEAAQKEQQNKRENELISELGKMNTKGVLERERPMFAQMQKDIWDNSIKKVGSIRAGDTNALMEIQQQLGNLNSMTEQSAAMKAAMDKDANVMLAHPSGGFKAYRQQSVDYLHDKVTNPAYNGVYDYDSSNLEERYNLSDYINKDLAGYAHEQAPNRGGYKSNTQEERKKLINDAVASDPRKIQAANDEYAEATDKLGADNPLDYIKKKYENNLLVNDTPAVQQWQTEQSKNDINVTHTEKDNGGEVHVMNKANNEQVTVDYNDKGEVTGGTQGKRLTPTQSAENSAVYKSNIAKEKAYNQQKRAADLYRASLDLGNMKEVDQKAALAKYDAMLPKKGSPTYTPSPLPYKEEGIQLDAKQAQEIAHDKFAIKPTDIINGKAPSHVDVQRVNQKTKPAEAEKIKVKRKSDGKTGTIDAKDFNPSKYDKI